MREFVKHDLIFRILLNFRYHPCILSLDIFDSLALRRMADIFLTLIITDSRDMTLRKILIMNIEKIEIMKISFLLKSYQENAYYL